MKSHLGGRSIPITDIQYVCHAELDRLSHSRLRGRQSSKQSGLDLHACRLHYLKHKKRKTHHFFGGPTDLAVALESISVFSASDFVMNELRVWTEGDMQCRPLATELLAVGRGAETWERERERNKIPLLRSQKGNKSCQCLWAVAPCEVIIIHQQLSGSLLWETRKARQSEKGKRWVEYVVIPSLLRAPYPCTHRLHHGCPPCCWVITFLRKMRFAAPRRLMIPFNLGCWSTRFQNSNQAFLSLLSAGRPYLMFKCCWLWTCPCSRLDRPYQLSDLRGDRFLQVCSNYTQRAYPKGKLNSTAVIDLLSSLELYIIGLGACPRIRSAVVTLISLMSGGFGCTAWRMSK